MILRIATLATALALAASPVLANEKAPATATTPSMPTIQLPAPPVGASQTCEISKTGAAKWRVDCWSRRPIAAIDGPTLSELDGTTSPSRTD